MRNKAYRINQRNRAINKARKVLKLRGVDSNLAPYWADNLAKASCWMDQPDGEKSQYLAVFAEKWEISSASELF